MKFLVVGGVLAVGVVATTLALGSSPPRRNSPSVYWGAYIEGRETYSHHYGGRWTDAPWSSKTWNRFESNAGKKVAIVHYGQPPPWEQRFSVSTADIVIRRGAIPLIDMSSKDELLTDVASGKYDSSFVAWAKTVKSWGKPFFLRWNWEMNASWFPWGAQATTNPKAFVAAWRRFREVVDGVGASNVTWVWCPNIEFSGSTPFERLYPGDAYVDWACLDGYNNGESSASFSTLFRQSYDRLRKLAPSKPIMIGEIGSDEYARRVKAAWIRDVFAAQIPKSFRRVKAVVWFNWRIEEGRGRRRWEIESSPSAEAAFRAAIASPYYAQGGAFGNLPRLTKVRPLR